MDKFIVTDEQWDRLKANLTEEEYNTIKSLEWEDFTYELNRCIDVRYIDDEPTAESKKLEDILYEIYNQNK